MASIIRLQLPSSFSFKNPDEWPRWKRRFEQFRLASGLSTAAEDQQVSTLLYCMGEDAEDTLSSTGIMEDERKSYETVLTKFDSFFNVRKNMIYKQARFNQRCQGEDESVEQFIASLYNLAENCAYSNLKDELIRDCIVVGIRDRAMSEHLQMDLKLTLESAKTMAIQREAVRGRQKVIKSETETEKAVEPVNRKPLSWGSSKKPP